MIRTALISILVLAVWYVHALSWAADRKAWVRLTDCQDVERDDNDGDSVHVQCSEQAFVVRLYFVAAPEATLRSPDRTREQSAYVGVTLDETVRAGRQATRVVRERLQTPLVVWTRWASAAGRTKTPRDYGCVEVEGPSLAAL